MKQHGKKKGTGKHDMIDKFTEHYDMTGTCAVYNGQINLSKIVREIIQKEIPVCPEPETSQLEHRLESKLAPMMKLIVQIMNNHEIGQAQHPLISKIESRKQIRLYQLKHEAIMELLKRKKIKDIVIDDNVNSAEYREAEQEWERKNGNNVNM